MRYYVAIVKKVTINGSVVFSRLNDTNSAEMDFEKTTSSIWTNGKGTFKGFIYPWKKQRNGSISQTKKVYLCWQAEATFWRSDYCQCKSVEQAKIIAQEDPFAVNKVAEHEFKVVRVASLENVLESKSLPHQKMYSSVREFTDHLCGLLYKGAG